MNEKKETKWIVFMDGWRKVSGCFREYGWVDAMDVLKGEEKKWTKVKTENDYNKGDGDHERNND